MIAKIWNYQTAISHGNSTLPKKSFLFYIPIFILSIGEHKDLIQAVSFSCAIVYLIRGIVNSKAMTLQLTPASIRFRNANLYLLNFIVIIGFLIAMLGIFLVFNFIYILFHLPSGIAEIFDYVRLDASATFFSEDVILVYGLYFANAMVSTSILILVPDKQGQLALMLITAIVLICLGIWARELSQIMLFSFICCLLVLLVPAIVLKQNK